MHIFGCALDWPNPNLWMWDLRICVLISSLGILMHTKSLNTILGPVFSIPILWFSAFNEFFRVSRTFNAQLTLWLYGCLLAPPLLCIFPSLLQLGALPREWPVPEEEGVKGMWRVYSPVAAASIFPVTHALSKSMYSSFIARNRPIL